ncbi:MAG: TetR/AcrR family transcriptional regulator [Thermoleophilaceae bacterium]|nr:TetR/AcrR family transcriptional regulator [Thermoleophilaceae bacterium]
MASKPRQRPRAERAVIAPAGGGNGANPRQARSRGRGEAVDKRRLILDAAVGVFARRGFTACRVSDVADEAGVAYGLVYHYFDSKEEILDTLFVERWQLMLDAIEAIDRGEASGREKLGLVASFIIDSYRHSPDVMKVIIVEVTRAAHSFGLEHLDHIRTAYDRIGRIVEAASRDGEFKPGISSQFAAMCFYGAIEQLLSAWIFGLLPRTDEEYDQAKELVVETICGGLEATAARPSA